MAPEKAKKAVFKTKNPPGSLDTNCKLSAENNVQAGYYGGVRWKNQVKTVGRQSQVGGASSGKEMGKTLRTGSI